MTRMKLPVKQGHLNFLGKFYGEVDNDTGDRLRWAQLKAFRGFGINKENPETFGREYYLLYAVGHSLAVHASDGCKGLLAPVSKFPELNEDWEDLEACPECSPDFSQDSLPDDQFKLEVTRYSHTQHPDAVALADALRKCKSCGHRPHDGRPSCGCGCKHYVKGDLSQIGQRLLETIQRFDPDIAALLPAGEVCL
jgi:hypothetical protein